MIINQHPDRETWLAHRTFIGASDSPSLLGVGYPGRGRSTVYADLVAGAADHKPSDPMVLGTHCQEGIIRACNEIHGTAIMPLEHATVVSDTHPYIGCSPDGIETLPDDTVCPVEVKNLTIWGTRELDEGPLPLKYQVQMQHQMFVMGAPKCLFVANCANERIVCQWYDRNDEFIAGTLLPVLEDLWGHVQRREVPVDNDPAVFNESVSRLFRGQTGDIKTLPEEIVDLDGEHRQLSDLLTRRAEADAAIKRAEATKKHVDAIVKLLLEDAAGGVLPGGKFVRRTVVERGEYTVAPSSYVTLRYLDSIPKGVQA